VSDDVTIYPGSVADPIAPAEPPPVPSAVTPFDGPTNSRNTTFAPRTLRLVGTRELPDGSVDYVIEYRASRWDAGNAS
jgi:hypothetical protein